MLPLANDRCVRTMKWIPYGPNAWLFQFADRIGEESFLRSRAVIAELEANPPPGLIEFVPAFTSVLLEFDPRETIDPAHYLKRMIHRLEATLQANATLAPIKEIPVTYDGPDLPKVAEMHQLTVNDVREIHSCTVYRVYMLGFAPGFPYLGDLDTRLHTPRLAAPRVRVPAGSVAIGGEHTGIYTVEGPGGWNLIGRTSVFLFHPEQCYGPKPAARDVFLLQAGDRVRFVPQK